MALFFYTSEPYELLKAFKKAIDNGRVTTWSYDDDGDFTHTPDQWVKKAWLRPKVESDRLALYILHPKATNISSIVYAVYHGRFIESMLVHCDKLFTKGFATAFPAGTDRVAPPTE